MSMGLVEVCSRFPAKSTKGEAYRSTTKLALARFDGIAISCPTHLLLNTDVLRLSTVIFSLPHAVCLAARSDWVRLQGQPTILPMQDMTLCVLKSPG